jgi:hypothetical protein
MICEEYEQLRALHQSAVRERSLWMTAPAYTAHSASQIQDAEQAIDELVGLLDQHKDNCARCGISVDHATK